uniref:Uncharacterized protein n=1 Tax=Anguilla anguilla TaxID=7936 RepID=A0A0E9VR67_ANGAN
MVSGESLVSETVLHGFLMLGGLCSCSVQFSCVLTARFSHISASRLFV